MITGKLSVVTALDKLEKMQHLHKNVYILPGQRPNCGNRFELRSLFTIRELLRRTKAHGRPAPYALILAHFFPKQL